MHQFERLALGFPVGKHGLRIVQANRLLTLLVGITPGRESLIVDPSTLLKLLFKDALLASGQMQAIEICGFTQFSHTRILAYNRIERKCYPCLPVGCIGVSATAFIRTPNEDNQDRQS
jgi:hypothetical protein